ncbi:hypothetical protein CCM_06602 [Cordyceps militaris CM01]|uniref:Uncharacterized protein n=1 Tax=Cordyceps militaris (strain CM01) TaxID=983644 RepID=G3JN01_CORMM|nr:uncharacterized protein CCM_06602 [Cordyceps militaris CM01]EGX90183.1 hypothetical protein CCM_06602 [Cordyceps militaris CM01]
MIGTSLRPAVGAHLGMVIGSNDALPEVSVEAAQLHPDLTDYTSYWAEADGNLQARDELEARFCVCCLYICNCGCAQVLNMGCGVCVRGIYDETWRVWRGKNRESSASSYIPSAEVMFRDGHGGKKLLHAPRAVKSDGNSHRWGRKIGAPSFSQAKIAGGDLLPSEMVEKKVPSKKDEKRGLLGHTLTNPQGFLSTAGSSAPRLGPATGRKMAAPRCGASAVALLAFLVPRNLAPLKSEKLKTPCRISERDMRFLDVTWPPCSGRMKQKMVL